MASVYKDPREQQTEPQYQNAQVQSTGQGNQLARTTGTTDYSGLSGLSGTTAQRLGQLQTGYRESDAVTNARRYLDSLEQSRPGDYQSSYKDQLDDLFKQIQNRGPFQYDLNGDMLWQQYKDQYMQGGRQAMTDAMAQAAALTGGYGSSYGASAGNQAYQQYLTQMTAMIPELYDRAAAQHAQGTQDLYNQYALGQQADATDYGRWQDQLAQWNADRAYGQQAYGDEYGRDYGQYQDMLNYWNNVGQQEQSQYMTNQQYGYNLALRMLAAGAMPSDDLLAQAGISRADARALLAQATAGGGGGRGSGMDSKTRTDLAAVANITAGTTPYGTNTNGFAALNPGAVVNGAALLNSYAAAAQQWIAEDAKKKGQGGG